MSYFAAQLGSMPIPTPHGLALWPSGTSWVLTWSAPPPGIKQAQVFAGATALTPLCSVAAHACRWDVRHPGPRFSLAWLRDTTCGPSAPAVQLPTLAATPPLPDTPTRCPLCQGTLAPAGPLWRCTGRCGARWLPNDSGQLLDLAGLALGICRCCERPRPLVRGPDAPLCPNTQRQHIIASNGQTQLVQQLDLGLCACCAPPQPLVQLEQHVICPAHPQQPYVNIGGTWQPTPPSATPSATLAAIDKALSANTAKWTLYGLFDVNTEE